MKKIILIILSAFLLLGCSQPFAENSDTVVSAVKKQSFISVEGDIAVSLNGQSIYLFSIEDQTVLQSDLYVNESGTHCAGFLLKGDDKRLLVFVLPEGIPEVSLDHFSNSISQFRFRPSMIEIMDYSGNSLFAPY